MNSVVLQDLHQPCCIALGQRNGHVLPGSRLTEDLTLRQALEALARIRTKHPNAGVYLSAVEDGKISINRQEHDYAKSS